MEHLPPTLSTALTVIGGLCCVKLVLCFLKTVLRAFQTFAGTTNLRSYGSWAIVTGSTDGIGKEIAKELARQKINIILISRNQEKLENVAKDISGKFNVDVKTVAMDMSTTQQEDYAKLGASFGELDVGIIVNNVGMSYDHPDYLDVVDPSVSKPEKPSYFWIAGKE